MKKPENRAGSAGNQESTESSLPKEDDRPCYLWVRDKSGNSNEKG